MALRLYQFAISHYCEKIRWALEFKGLSHDTINLVPGQHLKTIRRLTGGPTSVPVLDHDGHLVQGSAAILDYLDDQFPEHPLTPAEPDARALALDWEQRLDQLAGPAVRCYSYHHLLQYPKLVIPMLTAGTPFYNRILLSLIFSKVEDLMRRYMKINDKTADQSRQVMESLLTELAENYRARPYLAGDSFSRADLTAAALFAPLFQPAAYPVPWPDPERIPEEIRAWTDQRKSEFRFLEQIYHNHRQPA